MEQKTAKAPAGAGQDHTDDRLVTLVTADGVFDLPAHRRRPGVRRLGRLRVITATGSVT